MKLSVLLLLVLPALSSASLQDVIKKSSELQKVLALNPDLKDRIPKITPNGSTLARLTPAEFEKSQNQYSSLIFESTLLEWQPWSGSIPNGAVSIYNEYASRREYVCKYLYGCSAGFYNPSLGPYCRYSLSGKELLGSPFDILVNKDNFEILEWIEDSWGGVPENSVRTCFGVNVYVGKNEYGLGKVVSEYKAFFLPWEGDEYWYKYYQVLTLNKDIISQDITQVKYKTNGVKAIQYPPEAMYMSAIINNRCASVLKTSTLTKTNKVEKSWDIGSATTFGVVTGITAEIPFVGIGGSIEFSTETTKHFSKGTTVIESITYSVSVQQNVPPNHFCNVTMVGYKYKTDIPFTALIQRTYDYGETRWASISGTYNSIEVGEVQAVVGRCEPIPDAKPCA